MSEQENVWKARYTRIIEHMASKIENGVTMVNDSPENKTYLLSARDVQDPSSLDIYSPKIDMDGRPLMCVRAHLNPKTYAHLETLVINGDNHADLISINLTDSEDDPHLIGARHWTYVKDDGHTVEVVEFIMRDFYFNDDGSSDDDTIAGTPRMFLNVLVAASNKV